MRLTLGDTGWTEEEAGVFVNEQGHRLVMAEGKIYDANGVVIKELYDPEPSDT